MSGPCEGGRWSHLETVLTWNGLITGSGVPDRLCLHVVEMRLVDLVGLPGYTASRSGVVNIVR